MKQIEAFEGYTDDVQQKVNAFLATISNTNIVSIDWRPKTQRDGIYCVIIYNSYKEERVIPNKVYPWEIENLDNNLPPFKNPPTPPFVNKKEFSVPDEMKDYLRFGHNNELESTIEPIFTPDRIEPTWTYSINILLKPLKSAWAWISTIIKRGIHYLRS